MRLMKPSFGVLQGSPMLLELMIEEAGRTCYKSAKSPTLEGTMEFANKMIAFKHDSVLEHSVITVRLVCDRGVSHELVRHRIASYSQESTRYCNYRGGVAFIIPPWTSWTEREITSNAEIDELTHPFNERSDTDRCWLRTMWDAECSYLMLLSAGWVAQQARAVLPNSLKTEIVMTANVREWRHVFELRTSSAAHPQMTELMRPMLAEFTRTWPTLFGDITWEK